MSKGKVNAKGEGVNFATGQWKSATDKGIEVDKNVIPHNPLVCALITDAWRAAGVTGPGEKWREADIPGDAYYVGGLWALNEYLAEAGLPLYDAEADVAADTDVEKKKHPKAAMYTHGGRTMNETEWAKHLGVKRTTLRLWLKKMSIAEAVAYAKKFTKGGMHSGEVLRENREFTDGTGTTKTWTEWSAIIGITLSTFGRRVQKHGSDPAKVLAQKGVRRGGDIRKAVVR